MQDRFLRGTQIAKVISEYLRVTGARETVLDCSDQFSITGDDIHVFDTKWDQVFLSTSGVLNEMILESLYMMRLRESDELQKVLAMYEQETNQDRSKPSNQKLKTMVKRHTGQKIRTRNFQARNE